MKLVIKVTIMLFFIIVSLSSLTYADDTGLTTHQKQTRHQAHTRKRLKLKPNLIQEDSWTLNVESNIYREVIYLNPLINYSTINGWDFNFAMYNIPIQGIENSTFEYDTYIGISKTFQLNKNTQIIIGTQNGTNLLSPHEWHQFHFVNIRYDILPIFNWYIGPYYANRQITAAGNQVGIMTGFQLKVIPNIFHIEGDYISGHQNVSNTNINFQWFIVPKFQLHIGVTIPEINGGDEFTGIIGFTKDL